MEILQQPRTHESLQSIAQRGMASAAMRMDSDVRRISAGEITPERMVSLGKATTLYTLNLQLLKMSDEMVGQVLDLLA